MERCVLLDLAAATANSSAILTRRCFSRSSYSSRKKRTRDAARRTRRWLIERNCLDQCVELLSTMNSQLIHGASGDARGERRVPDGEVHVDNGSGLDVDRLDMRGQD